MCKNFEIKGFCKWGNKCCFAHGEEELRVKNHLNQKYKSKICKHFHRTGFCPYGMRCQYFHIKDSYDEFLMAFTEKLELKQKEMSPTVDMLGVMGELTTLTPRLDVFRSMNSGTAKGKTTEKSILEMYRLKEY